YIHGLQGLLNQSTPRFPTSNSVRLSSICWWLSCLLITLHYSSNLVAVLTIPVFPRQLDTVHQLADSGLRVSMVNYGESLVSAMVTSGQQDLEALGRRMDLVGLSSADASRAYQQALKKMERGSHAITDTYSYLKSFVQASNSSHYFLREQIFTGPLVFFFRKGSPWRKKINIGIRRLSEAGLLQKWYGDLMEIRKNESDTRRQSRPLTLHHLEGPFWLYILGISGAMAAFCVEISCYVYRQ
ncbi:Ionotropic glutamate receptor, partial [Trinorchestia longiramus]